MTTPAVAAVEVRAFQVTIPAGTTEDAPYTADVSFPARVVQAVTWKVPPGPSGLMGWKLTMSGGNDVVPTGGGWIVADNQSDTWPLTDQPDSGAWEVTGYNTDVYDHSVYLTFMLTLVQQPAAAPVPLSNAALSSPVSAGTAGVAVG